MKKILILLSLVSSLTFSKGLVIKGGIEYSNRNENIIENMSLKDIKSIITINDKNALDKIISSNIFDIKDEDTIQQIFEKIENKQTTESKQINIKEQIKLELSSLFNNYYMKTNSLYAKLGVEYGFKVYRKKNFAIELVPGAELSIGGKIFSKKDKEKFNKNNISLAKVTIDEWNEVSQDISLGQPLNNSTTNTLNIKSLGVYAAATVRPTLIYDVSEDLNLKAGFKVGLGLNYDKFNFYMNNKSVYVSKTTEFAIPYSLVLGVDYKDLSTDVEIGAKALYKKPQFNNIFSMGLNLGYKF